MLTLDHLAVSAGDLDAGVAHASAALGVEFAGGGHHARMGTHNRLLGLGATYLEVIAIDPAAKGPGHPRWFDLDRFSGPPRLTNWVARCDDLTAALARCPPGLGEPVDFERGPYRWRMAVPQGGVLPFDGCFPALIEWQGDAHPTQALPDCGLRLTHLRLTHPQGDALRRALAAVIAEDRIAVAVGDEPRLTAGFQGADGARWLS